MPSITPIVCPRFPVIVLGAHRSGTSMVCQMLENLGLFVGNQLDENHEAVFFKRINQTIFARAHAAWDHPQGVRQFLACQQAVELTLTALAADLRSHRIIKYLGWRRWFKHRSIESFDFPWGWKDPRNVFTLPLWLQLFPQSRIIYIVRHGVDVAQSLLLREQQALAHRREKSAMQMAKRHRRSYLECAGFKGSARCLTLAGGFALWEKYATAADDLLSQITNPILAFRFEDFLDDPCRHLRELVTFCQLGEHSDDEISRLAGKVDPSRSRAFTANPATAAFFEQVKDSPWLARFGYLEKRENGAKVLADRPLIAHAERLAVYR